MRGIEIFAGAGGLGIGVSRAGFRPYEVVEWDRWCCDTIRENRSSRIGAIADWPEPTESDIRPLAFGRFEGLIDLVTGGPPCQPFSLGGKHRGPNDGRDMWSEAVRVVRETKPRAFIFENVKGLTRETFATYLSYIVRQMGFPEIRIRSGERWFEHLARLEREHVSGSRQDVTYRVIYRVLNAADYGVPQRRERIVFVGFRSDQEKEWSFPQATHSIDALLWDQRPSGSYWERHQVPRRFRRVPERFLGRFAKARERPLALAWRTVRDAIGDLPDPEFAPQSAIEIANHRFQPGARSYPGHTGSPMDEPAKTLKAGVHGVPGGENMLCRPDGSLRYFSVRESARLQTFPDEFRFHGSWTETMRQLGNAVPVRLAEVVATSVKRQLLPRAG